MADDSPVDRVFREAGAIIEAVKAHADLSIEIAAADNLRKALLLAAASHFERVICTGVLEFVRKESNGNVRIEEFVRNKAIGRQYHTWFSWEGKNANQFFSLFGSEFSTKMKAYVSNNEVFDESIKAFLEIGNERNRLAHQDFATFSLEKTMEEIYALYQKALLFVRQFPLMLRNFEIDDGNLIK